MFFPQIMSNNSCFSTKQRILIQAEIVSFQAGLENFTSLLESILLNRPMLNFNYCPHCLGITNYPSHEFAREYKQAIVSSQEDKQRIKFKEEAKKCCKEKKITSPPTEWCNIPLSFFKNVHWEQIKVSNIILDCAKKRLRVGFPFSHKILHMGS